MEKYKLSKKELADGVKLTNKYKKKYVAVNKKGRVIALSLLSVLAIGGCAAGGYFGYKYANNSGQDNHDLILDPASKENANISEITTATNGDKLCNVSSTKEIETINVSIGDITLVINSEYKIEVININSVSQYRVTIFKSTIDKYSGNIIITPKFVGGETEDTCLIYFDTVGGSKIDPIKVKKGEKATKPSNPTKTDYEFAGWYYKDASDKEIDFDFDTVVENNLLLYARWNNPTLEDGLAFIYDSATNGYLVGYDSKRATVELPSRFSIPSEYNNLPVTGIFYNGFENLTGVYEINLPNTIKIIYEGAFYRCYNLKKISIPSSCEYIGGGAFEDCKALGEVNLSEGLLYLGNDAFTQCDALTEIVLPDSLKYIYDGAFYGCSGLRNVHVGKQLNNLPENAFADCDSLKSINIPSSIKAINSNCFYDCKNLKNVTFDDEISNWYTYEGTLLESKEKIIDYLVNSSDGIEKVTYKDPDGLYILQYVGDDSDGNHLCHYALYSEDGLSEGDKVVIKDKISITDPLGEEYVLTVTGISDYAFLECEKVDEVILPSTLTHIGKEAFYNASVKTISFADSTDINLKSIGELAFADSDITSFNKNGSYEFNLPESLVSLSSNAFSFLDYEYTENASVYIPKSVTLMDYGERDLGDENSYNLNAFTGSIFKKIVIADDNPYFSSDDYGIYLKSTSSETDTKETLILAFITNDFYTYRISDGVKKIENYSFDTYHYWGQVVSELTISKDVTYISPTNYEYISDVKIEDGNKTYLYNSEEEAKILYEVDENGNKYKIDHCFNKELTKFEVPDSITEIGSYAFYDLDYNLYVKFNSNLKIISDFAFAETDFEKGSEEGEDTLTIPASIEYVGYEAVDNVYSDLSVLIDSEYFLNLKYNITGFINEDEDSVIYINENIVSKLRKDSYIYNFFEEDSEPEKTISGYKTYKYKSEE